MSSITIPDSLPEILKNYVKEAIRSQPEDIISWSAEYFKNTNVSVGEHETRSTYKQDRTLIRILAFQLGTTIGTKERIEEVWSDLSLDFNLLEQIYKIGNFHAEHVDMVDFLGITFGHWTKSLKETILLCCEAFCKCLATDGYFLHVDTACKLYGFLAKLDCSIPPDTDSGHSQTTLVEDQHENVKNNKVEKFATVKSSKSLDVSSVGPSSLLADNNLKNNNICVSLESVFVPTSTTVDGYTANIGVSPTAYDHGYHVPGIGASIPEAQIQKVLEYFQKCAADNGGYVYDFDIENDLCPNLNAVNT